MGEALNAQMGEVFLDDERIPFGKEMLKQFLFDSKFKNLNHGTLPHSIVSTSNIDINTRVIWLFSSCYPGQTAEVSRSLRISTWPIHPVSISETSWQVSSSCSKGPQCSSRDNRLCSKCYNWCQYYHSEHCLEYWSKGWSSLLLVCPRDHLRATLSDQN